MRSTSFACLLLWLAGAAAVAEEASTLYADNCAACHGAGRLGGAGPALIPETLGRMRGPDVAAVIAEGRQATQMPAFADTLSPAEIDALAAYVATPLTDVPAWGEAEIVASLDDPGICPVFDVGFDGVPWIAMRYIDGEPLTDYCDSRKLSVTERVALFLDVLSGVAHAHQKGVLHRDLKPANVLIDEQDQVHVTDFGLAKHMDSDSSVTGSGAAVANVS